LSGGTIEKFEASDEVAESVFGSDGVEREAGAVVEDFDADAAGVLCAGNRDFGSLGSLSDDVLDGVLDQRLKRKRGHFDIGERFRDGNLVAEA
jgi:hypothetical protein